MHARTVNVDVLMQIRMGQPMKARSTICFTLDMMKKFLKVLASQTTPPADIIIPKSSVGKDLPEFLFNGKCGSVLEKVLHHYKIIDNTDIMTQEVLVQTFTCKDSKEVIYRSYSGSGYQIPHCVEIKTNNGNPRVAPCKFCEENNQENSVKRFKRRFKPAERTSESML